MEKTTNERDQSLLILKQFIRHYVSIVVKWRLYPRSCSFFKDKDYVGLHLKYMDPVDEDLQILNDDIYKITQWVEQGVIQNISSLKSFDLLLFYHDNALLELFSIELRNDDKSNNDMNDRSIASQRENTKKQIRDILEGTVHLIQSTTDEYKGKVSMNIVTKNQSSNNEFRLDEKLIQETQHHPMETIFLNRSENHLVMNEKKERYTGLDYIDELPLCQRSVASGSTISHINFESHAVHNDPPIRLGRAQFPCHDVVILHRILKMDSSEKDHCDIIQRLFHVDLRCLPIKQYDSNHMERKTGNFDTKQKCGINAMERRGKQRLTSPPHILSPNTPHPSSMRRENTPRLNKRKRTPVSSPRRSMQFGDTPILRRRYHEEEKHEVSVISPKIGNGTFGVNRTPRSGSSSEAPTTVVQFSTSESRGTNISPYSHQQRTIGRSSSSLPANKFHFSQDEDGIME